ncbi:hypothetical protein FGE12_12265 [Aggregicoccus sp. 17bor-14]|uniref:hypothetical protein n=1 Tax=Myxococcaceae TaxID=31 RepID=UPI00129C701B|nr:MULTISPECIES: hypothetical protein [Myxococcaceae]MBF5043164.1 hypothetical protein [Simulacricoccus sp. 17bor-14]MRI88923.1 hypothetical protein [Aggregicoccus sp. 17bor-14]
MREHLQALAQWLDMKPSDWFTCVLSAVALVISIRSLRVASQNNAISASSPWAESLLRHVEEEVANAAKDRDLFRRLCTVPFPDRSRKAEVVEALNIGRDDSAQRLYLLSTMWGSNTDLSDLKSKRDGIHDSFIENDELTFPKKSAQFLLAKYQTASEAYIQGLRKFARAICTRNGFPDEKRPSKLAFLPISWGRQQDSSQTDLTG